MKLRFHRYTHERSFRSSAHFANFADGQKAKFEVLKSNGTNDFEWWGKSIAQNWAQVAAAARASESNPQPIQVALNNHPVFVIESRLVTTLQDMTRREKHPAANEILPFLRGQRDDNTGAQLHVVRINAHAEFLAALALESSSRKNGLDVSLTQLLSELEDRFEILLSADQTELEAKRAAFEDLHVAAKEKFAELEAFAARNIETWQSQWLGTYNSFVEQLATETAVKLWSDRSAKHEVRYKSFRSWSVGFGIVGLVVTIAWIFGGFAFARYIFSHDATAQLASYTAGSLALFTLFVWGLRVLIRSMISEDHLCTDASARSALAHTYLALTKEQAATPEDRAIILATLFAPVSDGLVKDDGMPALSPAAIAAQILTNPNR